MSDFLNSGPTSAADETFMLIDAHALIYRAYYAFPELTTPDGTLVNAVFGFTRAVLTAIRNFEPRYLAVAFDHPQPTHRHQQFEDYKAHREKMPDDLIPQIEIIKKVVEVLNFPKFEMAGWEADDLIGTLAYQTETQLEAGQLEVDDLLMLIVTGDKDTFQLVNDRVHVWLPSRGRDQQAIEYDPVAVNKKMQVRPDQIIDLKALMGDASDNIPGVKGIGQKTAVKLLAEHTTLDGVYQALDELPIPAGKKFPKAPKDSVFSPSIIKKLITGREEAYLSQELATIQTDAPIELKLTDCQISGYDKQLASELFEELGFKSLIKLLPSDEFELGVEAALF